MNARSRLDLAAAILLLAQILGPIFVPRSAEAQPSALEALDVYSSARMQCLLQRATQVTAATPQGCYQLTSAQTQFIELRKQEFCTNPDAFCNSVKTLNVDERLSLFVNHSCQSATAQEFFEHDMAFYAPPPLGDAQGVSTLGPVYRRLWGCTEAAARVERSGSRAALRIGYSCDPSRVPFNCGGATAGTGETRANRVARQYNARIAMSGDRCSVSFTSNLPSGWPVPPAEGATAATYSSSLSADRQAQLEAKVFEVGSRGNRLFEATGSILGGEAEARRGIMRQVFTPENILLVQRMFDLAKRGLDAYLARVGAPATVRQTVRDTQLEDYSFILGPRPAEGPERDRYDEIWTNMNENCGQSSADPLGHDNAQCVRHEHRRYKVTICPTALIDALQGNPASLIPVLGHELGHSIDSCDMGLDLARDADDAGRGTGCSVPASVSGGDTYRFFTERMQPFTQCLQSNSTMPENRDPSCSPSEYRDECRPSIPMVRPSPRANLVRAAELLSTNPGCGLADLRIPSEGGTGLRASCMSGNLPSLVQGLRLAYVARRDSMEEGPRAEADRLLTELESAPQRDQSGEASADFFGSQAMSEAMTLADYPWPPNFTPGASDRAAEVVTAFAPICGWDSTRHDEHPLPNYRISLMASNPRLRTIAGCSSPVPAGMAGNGHEFPSASCSLAPPAPAATP